MKATIKLSHELLLIGSGGALGAVSRYLLSRFSHSLLGADFPYGTLVVNVVGCYLLGLLLSIITLKVETSSLWMAFFIIGFLGAFTTFSAFSYENFLFIQKQNIVGLLLNIFFNVVICLMAIVLGRITSQIF